MRAKGEVRHPEVEKLKGKPKNLFEELIVVQKKRLVKGTSLKSCRVFLARITTLFESSFESTVPSTTILDATQ